MTPEQVARLAAQAAGHPAALAQLRSITRVGTTTVDLRAALDLSGPALRARLALLAASPAGRAGTVSGAGARSAARAILAERRFRGSSVPRPLHRPLGWLGRQLRRAGAAVSSAVHGASFGLPGGSALVWTLLALAVGALSALLARNLGRRRGLRFVEHATREARAGRVDARALERRAEQEEAQGDYAEALRLRFQAGLIRLDDAGAIPAGASLTNGQIEQLLASGSFSRVAEDFDEVVYGDRLASPADLERARRAWPTILEESRRR